MPRHPYGSRRHSAEWGTLLLLEAVRACLWCLWQPVRWIYQSTNKR